MWKRKEVHGILPGKEIGVNHNRCQVVELGLSQLVVCTSMDNPPGVRGRGTHGLGTGCHLVTHGITLGLGRVKHRLES